MKSSRPRYHNITHGCGPLEFNSAKLGVQCEFESPYKFVSVSTVIFRGPTEQVVSAK